MRLAVTLTGLLALGMGPAGDAARSKAAAAPTDVPQYTADGKLVRPEGYRKWVYLSSGFGMSYNPGAGGNGAPAFTNVFVNPAAYDYFAAHGNWPDKTMLVLEIFSSTSKGSINQHGSFQKNLQGLDVEVKDEGKFTGKWAYFGFDGTQKSASDMQPAKNDCWTCHDQNAAVEHSFVQFYPELLKIAKEKGTLKKSVKLD